MNQIELRAKLLSAALQSAADDQSETYDFGNPHAGAQAELCQDMLDATVKEYAEEVLGLK